MNIVKISDNNWNYLKEDGTYLLDEHVYFCFKFYEGIAAIQLSEYKFNYINTNGEYLLHNDVYYCEDFNYGIGCFRIYDNLWNFINVKGEILLKKEVIYLSSITNKCCIKIDNKFYYIDKNVNFYDSTFIKLNTLYNKYPQKRQELISIIDTYTFFDVNEYFNI